MVSLYIARPVALPFAGTKSAWDFFGVDFFGVLLEALGIFLGFDFWLHLIIPVT